MKLIKLPVDRQKAFLQEIWVSMEQKYGQTFFRKYGPPIQDNRLTTVGLGWFDKLKDMEVHGIRKALDACFTEHPSNPPTLPQFWQLCKVFQPKERKVFEGVKRRKCEYRCQDGECQNEGTISASTIGGGPWMCNYHFFGGNGLMEINSHSWVRNHIKDHKKRHPELQPSPGETPKQVKEKNLAYIKEKLGGRDIFPPLPYDKNSRVAGG
jgi:hypothetical protein